MKLPLPTLLLATLAAAVTLPAAAQTTVYDFEDGTTQGFASITRPDTYDDEPVVVTSSTEYPGAFPPPTGTQVLSVEDTADNSFGLCSAVGGTIFNRTGSSFTSATLTADIYVVASASGTEGNVALLAINDGTPSLNEAYYRFGYRNNEVFLQYFNGAAFTTLGTDTALDDTDMVIPGWNNFRITFTGLQDIELAVNGAEPSFSPLQHTAAEIDEEIQVGVLGFYLSSFSPVLADNITETIVYPSLVQDWQDL